MAEESKLQGRVLDWLREHRVYCVKIVAATTSGNPDIVGCAPDGLFFAIECKSETGSLTALQRHSLNIIQDLGGLAFEVRPSNFENFKTDFERRFLR